MTRPQRLALGAVAVLQIVLLLRNGQVLWYQLNPDGVSYLRLAEYIATGQWPLVVSGYWSPLLIWLVAPAVALGAAPLAAAKVVLGLAAIAYLWATVFLLRRAGVGGWGVVFGAVLAGSLSAAVAFRVNPDVLSGAVLALAVGVHLHPEWPRRWGVALGSGALLGLAYLAKAVMLPVGIVLVPCWGLLWAWSGRSSRGEAARAAGWALVGLVAVAGPWVTVLSVDHGHPTFSEAGPVAHALMGSDDLEDASPIFDGMLSQRETRYRYNLPEPGRVVATEDQRGLVVEQWSPFESWDHFAHQGQVVIGNVGRVVGNVRWADRFATGIWALLILAIGLALPRTRERLRRMSWWWPAVPAVGLMTIYLPVYAGSPRYAYPLIPLLLAVTLGGAEVMFSGGRRRLAWCALALVALSYTHLVTKPLRAREVALDRREAREDLAALLARRLAAEGTSGRLASIARLTDAQAVQPLGMATAFFLDAPYVGNEHDPDVSRLVEGGVRIVLVARGHPAAQALAAVPGAETHDVCHFALGDRADVFPVCKHGTLVVLPPRDVSPAEAQRVFDSGW